MTPPPTSATVRMTETAPDFKTETSVPEKRSWHDLNHDWLNLNYQRIIEKINGEKNDPHRIGVQLKAIAVQMSHPSNLERLGQIFRLSELERDILLLICLADEPPKYAKILQSHPLSIEGRSTPALIEDIFGKQAIECLAPHGTLRQTGLVTLASNGRFFEKMLSVEETILSFLQGQPCLSEDILNILKPATTPQLTLGEAVAISLGQAHLISAQAVKPVHFHYQGDDPLGLSETLGAALLSIKVPLLHLSATALLDVEGPWHRWLKRASRDMNMLGASVIITLPSHFHSYQIFERVAELIPRLAQPAYVIGQWPKSTLPPQLTPLILGNTDIDTRKKIWESAVRRLPQVTEAEILATATHFNLSTQQIRRSAQAVLTATQPNIWTAARQEAGSAMHSLAKAIPLRAGWDDLILPAPQSQALREMASFLSQREKINSEWGFSKRSARGLGMAALFYGASGTGKTTAAEVLIKEMTPPGGEPIQLFRIDTASLVSKYIGETAKNLSAIFQAGEKAGAALLFDEAEGLFAKRTSSNGDSLNKHSNAELGFLLQCLEDYPGVSILTTNMRQLIDDAFLRRFRFVIEFPYPDSTNRELIWRRAIPQDTPTGTLDYQALAKPPLSGGNIRSIVINAAYQAAASQTPLQMRHLARAMRLEFAKMDKPAPEHELRKWGHDG